MTYDTFYIWRQRWEAIKVLIATKRKALEATNSFYSSMWALEAYTNSVRENIGLFRSYYALVNITSERQVMEAVVSGSDDLDLLQNIVDYALSLTITELRDGIHTVDF